MTSTSSSSAAFRHKIHLAAEKIFLQQKPLSTSGRRKHRFWFSQWNRFWLFQLSKIRFRNMGKSNFYTPSWQGLTFRNHSMVLYSPMPCQVRDGVVQVLSSVTFVYCGQWSEVDSWLLWNTNRKSTPGSGFSESAKAFDLGGPWKGYFKVIKWRIACIIKIAVRSLYIPMSIWCTCLWTKMFAIAHRWRLWQEAKLLLAWPPHASKSIFPAVKYHLFHWSWILTI